MHQAFLGWSLSADLLMGYLLSRMDQTDYSMARDD